MYVGPSVGRFLDGGGESPMPGNIGVMLRVSKIELERFVSTSYFPPGPALLLDDPFLLDCLEREVLEDEDFCEFLLVDALDLVLLDRESLLDCAVDFCAGRLCAEAVLCVDGGLLPE